MRSHSVVALTLATVAMLLASCAKAPLIPSEQTAQDWKENRTIIGGDEADTVLVDDQLLLEAVRSMGPTDASDNIRQLIAQVRAANGGKGGKGLSGLGGAIGHAFLDAAEDALKPGQGNIDRQQRVRTRTYGKIIDYEYVPSSAGWSAGTGKLHVIMVTETVRRNRGPGAPPGQVKRQAFKWEISVVSNGFTVHKKVPSPGWPPPPAWQPFPLTMEFSAAMKRRVELRSFEYKLWAEGSPISIDTVYHGGNNFDPAKWDDPNVWTAIPRSGPHMKKYQGLYDIDQYSCIDLMFVPYAREDPSDPPIPVNMDELTAPPFYCLGRCDDPPIINTE
jgi:hypothetical protein